jgi:hypothetical protein
MRSIPLPPPPPPPSASSPSTRGSLLLPPGRLSNSNCPFVNHSCYADLIKWTWFGLTGL